MIPQAAAEAGEQGNRVQPVGANGQVNANNKAEGGGGWRFGRRHSGGSEDSCFSWACCCSCSWSEVRERCRKRKEDANPEQAEPEEPRPSLEEIRTWGRSFEKLMKSAAGRNVFREFLRCEYSEENILFWIACEDLKKEGNPDIIEEKARFIYEDYISILSPKEVSLDSRVREIVNRNMVAPSPHTFDEAQLQIYTLMHRDSYPRFVNSPLYKQIAQLNNNSENASEAGSIEAQG